MDIKTIESNMSKAIDSLKHELAKVRTGRANPSMVEGVMVEAYGAPTPINQVAMVTVAEARQLLIKPFDPSLIGEVEKGINNANLGLNPSSDGQQIRLNIPALTEETRKKYAKDVKAIGEDHKVRIRNARQDANNQIKKSDELTDDEKKSLETNVQDLTNKYNKDIDSLVAAKEEEVMTI